LLIFQKVTGGSKLSSDAYTPLSISSTAIQFHKSKKEDQKTSFSKKNPLKSENHHSLIFSDKAFREAIFVIVLFILFSFASAIAISYLTKSDFINALFEASSALSNTGLTVGMTTMDLDIISKLILSINMIFGRFEIITILYIFISKLR
jgi:trk system potassium uptake protein TrkH